MNLDELCQHIECELGADKVDWSNTVDFNTDAIAIRVIWRDKPKTVVGIQGDINSLSWGFIVNALSEIKENGCNMWLFIERYKERFI